MLLKKLAFCVFKVYLKVESLSENSKLVNEKSIVRDDTPDFLFQKACSKKYLIEWFFH